MSLTLRPRPQKEDENIFVRERRDTFCHRREEVEKWPYHPYFYGAVSLSTGPLQFVSILPAQMFSKPAKVKPTIREKKEPRPASLWK